MIKLIVPNSGDFDQAVSSLVPVHSRGVDTSWTEKRASQDFIRKFADVRPKEGHSLIHLIAMGASDSYNLNRNGDIFYKTARDLNLLEPDWTEQKLANGQMRKKSAETFKDRTDVGLLDTYGTFVSHGKVFRDHKNKPHMGDRVWGNIKAAGYNDDMDRVELLIEVDNNEWADDLQKLASGQDIPFSMACVLDPSFPVMTAAGYKPISDVTTSDQVLTHKGNWKTVKGINRRDYSGKAVTLKFASFPLPVTVTADHPLYVIRHANKGRKKKAYTDWVAAKDIREGDFVCALSPTDFPESDAFESPYLSSFLSEVMNSFYVSKTELQLAERLLGPDLADIPLELFNSADKVKYAFLGAIIDGEDSYVTPETVGWLTPDLYQGLTVKDLFASLNIPVRLIVSDKRYKLDEKDVTGETSVEAYEVQVPIGFMKELIPYSTVLQLPKIHSNILDGYKSDFEDNDNFYNYCKVIDRETFDVESTTVYNIEVADDESYLLGGLVSHNCKVKHDICNVCGNVAKTRDEYCTHAKNELTSLTKSGHAVGVVNDHMTFFDISRVNRPADRIAYSLVKAANVHGLSGADLAIEAGLEDYDEYPDPSELNITTKAAYDKLETLKKLAELEKQVDLKGHAVSIIPGLKNNKSVDTPVNVKGKPQKFTKAAGSLAKTASLLDFDNFCDILFGDNTNMSPTVKEAKSRLPYLFRDAIAESAEGLCKNSAYDPDFSYDTTMDGTLKGLAAHGSLDYSAIQRRNIENAIRNETIKIASTNNESVGPKAKALLRQYATYKLAFVQSQSQVGLKNLDMAADLATLHNFVQ